MDNQKIAEEYILLEFGKLRDMIVFLNKRLGTIVNQAMIVSLAAVVLSLNEEFSVLGSEFSVNSFGHKIAILIFAFVFVYHSRKRYNSDHRMIQVIDHYIKGVEFEIFYSEKQGSGKEGGIAKAVLGFSHFIIDQDVVLKKKVANIYRKSSNRVWLILYLSLASVFVLTFLNEYQVCV